MLEDYKWATFANGLEVGYPVDKRKPVQFRFHGHEYSEKLLNDLADTIRTVVGEREEPKPERVRTVKTTSERRQARDNPINETKNRMDQAVPNATTTNAGQDITTTSTNFDSLCKSCNNPKCKTRTLTPGVDCDMYQKE